MGEYIKESASRMFLMADDPEFSAQQVRAISDILAEKPNLSAGGLLLSLAVSRCKEFGFSEAETTALIVKGVASLKVIEANHQARR